MAEFVRSFAGLMVRLVLLLAGLVFFASVLATGFVVLSVWLLRALWAKVTGKPVQPWIFQMNRQTAWQHFYQRGQGQQAQAADPGNVVDAEAKDVTVVTDVEPKRITPR